MLLDHIGLCFDTNGIKLPYRLFASTWTGNGGSIFMIEENGTNMEQIYTNNNAELETVLAVPTNTSLYGTLAGKVIACDENTGSMVIVNPTTGAASSVDLQWFNTNSGTWARA